MSLSDYSSNVRTQVDSLVPAALATEYGTVGTDFDFKKPNVRKFNGGSTTPKIGKPWVTYTIQTYDNLNISSGFRWNEGVVEFLCFVPLEAGAGDAETLTETVAGALRGETFTGGHFRNARVVELGDDGSGWFQYNVLVEFYQDETS